MLNYQLHNPRPSDKFGILLVKEAKKLDNIKNREGIHIKMIYVDDLSENYKYPNNILFEKIVVSGLKVECISYKKAKPKYALIHLHGGAYVLDYNDTYRQSAKRYLQSKSDLKVFSPLYSLAPTHPYPVALNEVVNLYKYLLNNGYNSNQIIIAGDSAGGGLTIALTLYLRDNSLPLPKALITMSAWTNLAMNGESHKRNFKNDLMFGEGSIPLDVHAYVQGNEITNPYISPYYGDFTEFTDMLMFVGSHEMLESDTLDIAKKAGETNEVIVHNFLEMFHVFPLGFNKLNSARKAWEIIKNYINVKFRG